MGRLRTVLVCCLLFLPLTAGCSDRKDTHVEKAAPTRRIRENVEVSCSTSLSPDKKVLEFRFSNGVTMKLVLIPAGKFTMGSPKSEPFRDSEEGPQHEVTISKPFYMGIYEVTQSQWCAVTRTEVYEVMQSPWREEIDTELREGQWREVIDTELWEGQEFVKIGACNAASWISWDDASKFCKILSKKTGKRVVLPTEAQWEYACRAGTTTAFSCGDDASKLGDYAWYYENTDKKGEKYAHPVGRKKANAFGLYDMHGNVLEWCRDSYVEGVYTRAKNVDPEITTETEWRVLRGGSWWDVPTACRAAYRGGLWSDFKKGFTGFRVVVELGSDVK